MSILFFALFQVFAAIGIFVAIAWTRPRLLVSIASILCRIADASAAARSAFNQTPELQQPTRTRATNTDQPFLSEVTSALVNLGTTPTAAKAATRKAIMSPELSPAEHNFDSIFKLALQFAR